MFGNNELRKQQLREDGTLAVQSIFYTIQGEGPSAGTPAVFVRLAGCNLACWFCDTDFESNITNLMTVDQIVKEVLAQHPITPTFKRPPLIVLTGGEPLRQNVVPLIDKLERTFGNEVEIETAGTLWVQGLEHTQARIICSPKTPTINARLGRHVSAWKYVVRDGFIDSDGLPTTHTQNITGDKRIVARPLNDSPVFLSPMDESGTENENDPTTNVASAVNTCMKHGYRLSLQTHKIIGVE